MRRRASLGVRSANPAEVLQESFRPSFPDPGFLIPRTRLMLELTRVMFPYMLLVCLAALFMGILNARGHFFVPAMGAVMLSMVMILVVLFVAPRFGAALDSSGLRARVRGARGRLCPDGLSMADSAA